MIKKTFASIGAAMVMVLTASFLVPAHADQIGYDHGPWPVWHDAWKFPTGLAGSNEKSMWVELHGWDQKDGMGMKIDKITIEVDNNCNRLEKDSPGAVLIGVFRIRNYFNENEYVLQDEWIQDTGPTAAGNYYCKKTINFGTPIAVSTNRAKIFMRLDKVRVDNMGDQFDITDGVFFCRGGYANAGCEF